MVNNVIATAALMIGSFITVELSDNAIARLAHRLLQHAGTMDELELGAFIVKTPRGALDLHVWPMRGRLIARWDGPLPDGVVAVMHTHPQAIPRPSTQDRAEAIRLQLPNYVVSRRALCVADESGAVRCARSVPWLRFGGMTGEVALQWQVVAMSGP